ncbi:hypothetical protein GWK47_049066 [Chionoecetes opilio]|uniref:Uncharacterized protein n=1 Tax=Chionoecetes opilio TaxID=41210 RepID=A0A8J5CTG1_CHIOP|nr:hypothetical protein GWK47_049066 [Chionoecetes opilio]
MVAMMERLLTPGGGVAASSDHRPATNDALARLPAAGTPAPFLTSSASLRDLAAWKMKFEGYMLLTRVDNLPPKEQRAILLSPLDEDWTRVIRYALPVAEDTPAKEVVRGMEAQSQDAKERLGGSARVLIPDTGGRGDFRRLLCSLKEIASLFLTSVSIASTLQIRDRVVCGARDDEA